VSLVVIVRDPSTPKASPGLQCQSAEALAKAGKRTIQYSRAVIEKHMYIGDYWMPAFAGMTGED
jgi:hypothetical protein